MISGILVGVASIFAVINFADIPAEEIRFFILTTLLFIAGIVVLALLAVTVFKLLGWVKNRIASDNDDAWDDAGKNAGQDSADDDKA